MKGLIRIISALCFLLSASISHAKDPISWAVGEVFPAQASIGQTYLVAYTFTNQLPFTLVNPLVIEHSASPAMEFNFEDKCSGRLLISGESCLVIVALNPLVIGSKNFRLTIAGYSRDRVPLPEIRTLAVGQALSSVVASTTTSLPYQLTNGSTASYRFTFTNQSATQASNLAVQVTQTVGTPSYTTTCSGNLAANGGVCTVDGNYTVSNSTPSIQQVVGRLSYTGPSGSPVQTRTVTQVVNPAAHLVGTLVPPNYLPPVMVQGQVYPVNFLFTANGSVDITGSGTIACTVGGSPCPGGLLSGMTSNCTPQTLTNAACEMTVNFTAPPAVSPADTYVLTATVPYEFNSVAQPDAEVETSGAVLAALSQNRTVTVVNSCGFDLWFSLNGSSLAATPNCPSQACPAGTSCNTSTHKCYWNNPAPNIVVSPAYYLAPGDSNNVTIPVNNGTDPNILWSGNISASTGCNGTSSCVQATCGNNGGSTACAPGVGFSQPATQAEITMELNNPDSYDVEVINGFHIPISMQPVSYDNGGVPVAAVPDNYTCGTPGQETAGNGFGACNWDNAVVPVIDQIPGNGFYWVTPGGNSCSITAGNAGCGAGTLCGLDASFNQVCGNFLGYWSSDQVCGSSGVPAAVQNYFKCNQPLPTVTTPYYPANATLSKLMLCAVPTGYTGPRYNTCYNSYPSASATDIAQCCGCVDWWNPGQTGAVIGSNPNTQSCTQAGASQPQTNVQWNSYVQPQIQWMKQACPSAYTYPFDDKTSGFTCSNNLPAQPNSTGYVVTFCPGGVSGLPAGITEGR